MPELRSAHLILALVSQWGSTARPLSEECKCSKTHMSDLIAGRRVKTTEATAVLLAAALKVPYSTLFVAPEAASPETECLVPAQWVAERLGQTLRWVWDQAATGALPSTRFGRHLRFKPSDVDAFIAANGSAAA